MLDQFQVFYKRFAEHMANLREKKQFLFQT